jgi:regulator of replication initiation timing
MSDAYTRIMDRLSELSKDAPDIEFALKDVVLSIGFLGLESRRMRRALDELAADAWEDANMPEAEIDRPTTLKRGLYLVN